VNELSDEIGATLVHELAAFSARFEAYCEANESLIRGYTQRLVAVEARLKAMDGGSGSAAKD